MTLFLLFSTGILAGMVDAISGGGGLITVPVLMSMGMPPHVIFGTNKLQGVFGIFIAIRKYYQHGLIEKKKVYLGICFGLLGSLLGAIINQLISNQILYNIVPAFLSVILIYTLLSPRLGEKDQPPRFKENWFYFVFGLMLGFYDGFFGPGVGALWVFVLTFFLGFNLIKATAYSKVFNFTSCLIAIFCFILKGNVDYKVAFIMAFGSIIGARLGAHLAIMKGAKLIRPIFLSVISVTIVSLFYRTYSISSLLSYLNNTYGLTPQMLLGFSLFFAFTFIYMRLRKTRAL